MAAETELCIYAQVDNPNFENTEGSDRFDQYESKLESGAGIRVRVYEKGQDTAPKCIQTIKVNAGMVAGVMSRDEYNCQIPFGYAQGFIKGASTVQKKRRDSYKSNKVTLKLTRGDEVETHDAPELLIEVDRFLSDAGYHPWVKIDIEIDGLVQWLKSNYGIENVAGYHIELDDILPCKVLKIIESNTKDEEEKKVLETLWDTMFKKKLNV